MMLRFLGRVILRILGTIAVLTLLAAVALLAWAWFSSPPARAPTAVPAARAPAGPPAPPVLQPGAAPATCGSPPAFAQAAGLNAMSISSAAWSAFGRPETGWEIYAPMTAHEIGTDCQPDSPGFAAALAAWQHDDHPSGAGVMDEATLTRLRTTWLRRRPFVAATAKGACPAPPPADQLVWAGPDDGYWGKPVQLRAGALAAYRDLRDAARAALPELARDPHLLTIFSGYRDPALDPPPCAPPASCHAIARATCSAHRTGLAMDIYLGAAPGYSAASADDPNRLFQSRSLAYRWMVANAARFGWVNYPFEPWHWEWTGEAP